MAIPRHFLIISSQCDEMVELKRLDEAREAMRLVLEDANVGVCTPASPTGNGCLHNPESAQDVEKAVRNAIRHAGEVGGTLFLAFLGHGRVSGNDSVLYFMNKGSGTDSLVTCTNVPELLFMAAEEPGVNGVVAIIDTCHSGGGAPDYRRLSLGSKGGRVNLAIIAASTALQDAYDLAFSRELSDVLAKGLQTRETKNEIRVDAELKRELQRRFKLQDCATWIVGDDTNLWLALNKAARLPGPRLESPGLRALVEALAAWQRDVGMPTDTSEPVLQMIQLEATSFPDLPSRERVLAVIDDIRLARKTRHLISELGIPVTSSAVARALSQLDLRGVFVTRPRYSDLSAVLEYTALTFVPVSDGDSRSRLVRFVVALIEEVGSGYSEQVLREWARQIDAEVCLNDELSRSAERARGHRLRLVIVLDTPHSNFWPGGIDCWLLDGDRTLHRKRFDCLQAKRALEKVVEDAVEWADEEAETLGLEIRRVDVAAPAWLLLEWRPEDVGGDIMLAAEHNVTLHWSERLRVRATTHIRRARRSLSRIRSSQASGEDKPISWLTLSEMANREELVARVRRGQLAKAIGLAVRPDASLLEFLLGSAAILVWPQVPDVTMAHKCALEAEWEAMPEALSMAYRRSLAEDEFVPLGEMRAIWDDREWLDFCVGCVRGSEALL